MRVPFRRAQYFGIAATVVIACGADVEWQTLPPNVEYPIDLDAGRKPHDAAPPPPSTLPPPPIEHGPLPKGLRAVAFPRWSGTTLPGVWAVFATTRDDAWSVTSWGCDGGGEGCTALLHWDGDVWRVVDIVATQLFSIWAAGPNDVWLGGNGGVYHYDGTDTSVSLAVETAIVAGAARDDVWAFEPSQMSARHYDGTQWSTASLPMSTSAAQWPRTGPHGMCFTTTDATILCRKDKTWTTRPSLAEANVPSVLVGSKLWLTWWPSTTEGIALAYDGDAGFTKVDNAKAPITSPALTWASPSDTVFVSTDHIVNVHIPYFARYREGAWTELPYGDPSFGDFMSASAIHGTADDDVWIVGDHIYHWGGDP